MLAGRPNGGEHRRDGHDDDHSNADGSGARGAELKQLDADEVGHRRLPVVWMRLWNADSRSLSADRISKMAICRSAAVRPMSSRLASLTRICSGEIRSTAPPRLVSARASRSESAVATSTADPPGKSEATGPTARSWP